VVILTFNSEKNIASTLEAALKVSDDIHVVDSDSTDKTLEICEKYPVQVVKHDFLNYGVQRNWAIDNLPMKYDWELHLDDVVVPFSYRCQGYMRNTSLGINEFL
jgi:glycosyltransferase involved in cell wall biosynthesis